MYSQCICIFSLAEFLFDSLQGEYWGGGRNAFYLNEVIYIVGRTGNIWSRVDTFETDSTEPKTKGGLVCCWMLGYLEFW